jgi:hypothetical protein
VILTLCGTCDRAIFSWETPSLIEGLPPEVEWSHYVPAQHGECGDHFAVPPRNWNKPRLDKA